MQGYCSSGCPTPGAHKSWGECMRAKNTRIGYCRSTFGADATAQKKWDNELQSYRDARKQGINPAGTTMPKIEQALKRSDQVGVAYDAANAGHLDDSWTRTVMERG